MASKKVVEVEEKVVAPKSRGARRKIVDELGEPDNEAIAEVSSTPAVAAVKEEKKARKTSPTKKTAVKAAPKKAVSKKKTKESAEIKVETVSDIENNNVETKENEIKEEIETKEEESHVEKDSVSAFSDEEISKKELVDAAQMPKIHDLQTEIEQPENKETQIKENDTQVKNSDQIQDDSVQFKNLPDNIISVQKKSKFKLFLGKLFSKKKAKDNPDRSLKETKEVKPKGKKNTVTPYIDGSDHYHDHLMALVGVNLYLKIAFIVCLLLTFGSLALAISTASRSKIEPYVIAVDNHGLAVASGIARPIETLDERVLTNVLSRFLINVRTVTFDVFYYNEAIYDVYSMLRKNVDPAIAKINDFFTGESGENDGKSREQLASEQLINVKIESVLFLTKNTMEIIWIETHRDRENGSKIKPDVKMRGVISFIQAEPPTETEALRRNPFGIYVTDISWNEIM